MNFIDLHCHTIATKQDEPATRNVSSKSLFLTKITGAHVSVCAITNHNFFNSDQYEEFSSNDQSVLVLPGVELDVVQINGDRGHVIVIGNNQGAGYEDFKSFINRTGTNKKENANSFSIGVDSFITEIKKLDCLVVVHYGGKSPAISDETLEKLEKECSSPIFVEPSSLISAFIYMNNGMQSLVGSDVKDWSSYPGKDLPELKMPLESYDSLKLLLQKDTNIIEKRRDTKRHERPFDVINNEYMINESIPIYKDCNVIMGGKSSGKTIFLKAIKEYLCREGLSSSLVDYFSENVKDEYKKLLEYSPSDDEIKEYIGLEDCGTSDIATIRNFVLPSFGNSFSKIKDFYESTSKSKLSKQLGFVSCITSFSEDVDKYNKQRKTFQNDFKAITTFNDTGVLSKYLCKKDFNEATDLLDKAKLDIIEKNKLIFLEFHSCELANKCIQSFKTIYTQLKATSALPVTTGLKGLYDSNQRVIMAATQIGKILKKADKVTEIEAGELDGKGKVSICHRIGQTINSKSNLTAVKTRFVGTARDISADISKIQDHGFSVDLKSLIASLATLFKDNNVSSLKDFLGYQSYFVRENKTSFEPSKGEQSVLVLSKALQCNSPNVEFYLLDEPEMSVGHNYVSKVIVPRIKELCSLGKTVIVCTHDANIGVGTLPFQVIYREERNDGSYHTFLGNPFSDELTDCKTKEKKAWKEVAVEILEGGRSALNLREVTYGDRD